MADTVDNVITDIKKTSKYVTLSPETDSKRYKSSLKIKPATLKGTTDITQASVATAAAVIEAIATAESFSIEPNKLNEFAAKIIDQHNNVIANLVKQISTSIVDFEKSEEYKKIQTTVKTAVSKILNDKSETNVSIELTDKQKESIQKNINKIIAAIFRNIKNNCTQALWSLKQTVENKLQEKSVTSEWKLDEETIEKHIEKETEKEYGKLGVEEGEDWSLKVVNTILNGRLTYGVIKFQAEALGNSLNLLSRKLYTITGILRKSVLDPEKFNKFFDAVKHPDKIIQIINKAKRAAKLAKGLDTSESLNEKEIFDQVQKEYEKLKPAFKSSSGIEDERIKKWKMFKIAMQSKSVYDFSNKINNAIDSEKKLATYYGAAQFAKFSGKILATVARLSLKVFNTALGFSIKAVKNIINTATKMIGIMTDNLLMIPLGKITSSTNIMFYLSLFTIGLEILAKGAFAPGTKLRKTLDSYLDPVKKHISEKISDITKKVGDKIKEKLGIPLTEDLTFKNVLDQLIKLADDHDHDILKNVFKIIKFIVEKSTKVFDFLKGIVESIANKTKNIATKYTDYYNELKEKKSEELEDYPGYIREYTKFDFLFDFKDGLFPKLWKDISDWYNDNSVLKNIVNVVANIINYIVDVDPKIHAVLQFMWTAAKQYADHTAGYQFLYGVSPLIGYSILGVVTGMTVGAGGVDPEGKVGEQIAEYKKLYTFDENEDEKYNPIKDATNRISNILNMFSLSDNEKDKQAHRNLLSFSNALENEQLNYQLFGNTITNLKDKIDETKKNVPTEYTAEYNEYFKYIPEFTGVIFSLASSLNNRLLNSNLYQLSPEIREHIRLQLHLVTNGWDIEKFNESFRILSKRGGSLKTILSRISTKLERLNKVNEVRGKYLNNIYAQINSDNFTWSNIIKNYDGTKPIFGLEAIGDTLYSDIRKDILDTLVKIPNFTDENSKWIKNTSSRWTKNSDYFENLNLGESEHTITFHNVYGGVGDRTSDIAPFRTDNANYHPLEIQSHLVPQATISIEDALQAAKEFSSETFSVSQQPLPSITIETDQGSEDFSILTRLGLAIDNLQTDIISATTDSVSGFTVLNGMSLAI